MVWEEREVCRAQESPWWEGKDVQRCGTGSRWDFWHFAFVAGRLRLFFLFPELTLRAAAARMLLRADPALWVSFLGGSPV